MKDLFCFLVCSVRLVGCGSASAVAADQHGASASIFPFSSSSRRRFFDVPHVDSQQNAYVLLAKLTDGVFNQLYLAQSNGPTASWQAPQHLVSEELFSPRFVIDSGLSGQGGVLSDGAPDHCKPARLGSRLTAGGMVREGGPVRKGLR